MLKFFGGIFFGWSLGANDAANVFGTAVATRVVRFWTAAILASIFVLLGALLEGSKCMKIMGEIAQINLNQTIIVTFSAAVTMTILTILGIPASSSQAIMGAILGGTIRTQTPNWAKFGNVILCWVGTPIGAAIIAFILYHLLDFIFKKTTGITGAKFNTIIRLGILITGCMGAYSLGANNVANVTGIYVGAKLLSPFMASFIGGLSIVVGIVTYSYKVMETVGLKITLLGPLAALVAVGSEAITVYIYTHIGIPVSTSQAIVGAVTGIGLVRGIRAVNIKLLNQIFIGWLSTPVSAGIIAFLLSLFIH